MSGLERSKCVVNSDYKTDRARSLNSCDADQMSEVCEVVYGIQKLRRLVCRIARKCGA
jgi:hypothetical protein